MAKKEHDKLVSLASLIYSRNPSQWWYGLTSNEMLLLGRVNQGKQPFVMPSTNDQFTICLHRSSINNSVVKKFKIDPFSLSDLAYNNASTINYNTSYSIFR